MKSRSLLVSLTGIVSRAAISDELRSPVSPGLLNVSPGELSQHLVLVCVPRSCSSLGFAGQFVYFLQQAGVSVEDSYSFNLGSVGMGFIGTICSWWFLNKFGRRTIMVWGTFGLTAL